MNPLTEARVADATATSLVVLAPAAVAYVQDLPMPFWLFGMNIALAWFVGDRVYCHVIDDHLRLARERAAGEKE